MPPFTLLCTIRFTNQGFSSAELRFRLPPIDFAATCYRPHFVADNSGEYLGMEFISGEVSAPQQDALVEVKPLFEMDYSPLLQRGAVFAIMEGGKCVVMGRVEDVQFQAAV
ncbi:hypothetical protein [Kingella oralis]|jgi:hypothetical protein|uniref:hypothetical protein n=1 Tax=Kingella oralis TaxID=505 RepID=UPI002D7F4E0B|nr:hypothetical protein [Kingella oralis]